MNTINTAGQVVRAALFLTFRDATRTARRFPHAWASVLTMPDGGRAYRVIVMSHGATHVLAEGDAR